MNSWKTVILLIMISLPVIATGNWKIVSKVDSMTDEKKKMAIVENKEGFSLSVYRTGSGAVWANFSLPNNSLDVMGVKYPIFRVDKNEPHDLDISRQLNILTDLYDQQPKWINWQVFHGQGKPPSASMLTQFMNGKMVVFRYFLFTGGYKETSFSLSGARPIITRALGFNKN